MKWLSGELILPEGRRTLLLLQPVQIAPGVQGGEVGPLLPQLPAQPGGPVQGELFLVQPLLPAEQGGLQPLVPPLKVVDVFQREAQLTEQLYL